MQSDRQIFREQALKQYMQKQEKDITLNIFPSSVFTILWILFSLMLLATLLALKQQVPRFIAGPGIVLSQHEANLSTSNDMVVMSFLPATSIKQFHVGQKAIVQLAPGNPGFTGTIQYIEPGALSPADIQRKYMQNRNAVLNITQPSFVAEIKPAKRPLLAASYTGSLVITQINVGSQSILSLLTGVGTFIGE
jgi:hypothetical protein